ncbi:MAG: FAD-dependent oxidoreductase [Eubacteriales bacterium]|nr:FAD-dependent oxidoreductase [Eubacteriales bacterium]
MRNTMDCVIIGCGPAGVSAALYVARANLKVTVIGGDESALMKAEKIENYYGLQESLMGKTLFEAGLRQLERLGVERIRDDVVDITWENAFTLTCAGGEEIDAASVIFCTGAKRMRASIENLQAFEGRGVSYCAICDAFFYRNKAVAVLGSGAYALHEAMALLPVAESVTLLTNGQPLAASYPETIKIIDKPIHALQGDDKLTSVCFADGDKLAAAGLFVAIGTAGASDLARKLGVEVRGSDIVTNENMETMLPGLFAAGDCTGGILQVSTAVAEGAKAGMSAVRFLRSRT